MIFDTTIKQFNQDKGMLFIRIPSVIRDYLKLKKGHEVVVSIDIKEDPKTKKKLLNEIKTINEEYNARSKVAFLLNKHLLTKLSNSDIQTLITIHNKVLGINQEDVKAFTTYFKNYKGGKI